MREKLKVVIDTNVLLGAMNATLCPNSATRRQWGSKPIVDYALANCAIVFTEATLEEFEKVAIDLQGLTYTIGPSDATDRLRYIESMKSTYPLVEPGETELRCRDKNDVMILEAARGAGAAFIISNDDHILSLQGEGACRFVKPHRFFMDVISPLPSAQPVPLKTRAGAAATLSP